MNFHEVLDPIGLDEFTRRYWTKELLYIPRNRPNAYESVLTFSEFDKIVTVLTHSQIRLVQGRNYVDPQLYDFGRDKQNMIRYFNSGYSIIYDRLDQNCEPLKNLCQEVSNFFKFSKRVYANVYLSPASSMAFKRHSDWQDVFVLQIQGRKVWKLFEPVFKYPANDLQTQMAAEGMNNAKLLTELTLSPGDLLYVPRGFPHEVQTVGEDSLHISLSVESVTKFDVMYGFLTDLAEKDYRLRETLPNDFLVSTQDSLEELQAYFGGFNANQLPKLALKDSLTNYINLKGYFTGRAKLNAINNNSKFALRSRQTIAFVKNGDSCSITSGTIHIGFKHANKEIAFMIEHEEFTLKDLPGDLDEDEQIELMNALVKSGIASIL